jgi:SpoVK/Ycf46/Vps4 family AAA+-type ATPase
MAEKFQPTPLLRRHARIMHPKDAEEPILTAPVREAVHQWMTEIRAAEDLLAVKVAPRRSALLSGPPGCGKTTLAHHFAMRLGLPLICVQMDTLVGAYIGETGKNLAGIFEDIEGQEERCILFFDEFDAIAKKRTEGTSSGDNEMNRVVNGLLQRLENFGGTFIAATNRADHIDQAIWRRFGLQLEIGIPGDDERYAILARYLDPLKAQDDTLEFLTGATAGAPPSLLRQLAEGVKRDLVLSPRLDRGTSAAEVFGRVLVSVRPHVDYVKPPLWDDRDTQRGLRDIPWPPTKPGKGK